MVVLSARLMPVELAVRDTRQTLEDECLVAELHEVALVVLITVG